MTDYTGLPVAHLPPFLPVHRETLRRWRRRRRIPPIPLLALRLRLEGDLGLISPAWTGWTLAQAQLVSPEGICWTADLLAAWHYERQLLASLQRQAELPKQEKLRL